MHFIREAKTNTPKVDAHPTSGIPRSHMTNFGNAEAQPEALDSSWEPLTLLMAQAS
jgi:hypothetical protein